MCQGVPIGILSILTIKASPMLEKDGKKKLCPNQGPPPPLCCTQSVDNLRFMSAVNAYDEWQC